MFKVIPNPTFSAPVKIPVPGAKPEELTLVFKHKTRDELSDFFARASKSGGAPVMMEIIEGWTGADQEFSEAALTDVLQNYHGAVQAIFDAYVEQLTLGRQGN